MQPDFDNINEFDDFNREISAKERLGNIISNSRITQGVDLATVAANLRVGKNDLEALEKGQELYSRNASFARLLCRKYITYLKIDFTDELEALIDEVYPQTFDPTLTQKLDVPVNFDGQIKKQRRNQNIRRNLFYIVALLVLMFIAVISIRVLLTNIKETTVEVANETTLIDDTILAPQSVVEPEIIEPEFSFVSYENQIATYDISNLETAGTYKLVVKADSGDCYVDVTDPDGNFIGDTGVLVQGKEFEYDIEDLDQVRINLGNTSVAKIFIDDIELDLSDVTGIGKNYIVLKDANE